MTSAADIAHAVRVLREGGVVACPTETFVGLLADARNAAAVERVCAMKGRDPSSPIGVIIPSVAQLEEVVAEVPPRALALAQQHWPGPLTLVLRARAGLHSALQKDGKIGVRVPGSSPALALVQAFGGALTATSANLTGQPAARTSSDARAIFGNGLGAVIEGESPGGLASTVVDATGAALMVIRPGPVELGPA